MIEKEKKEDLITNLKKYSIGFPCIYKIEKHYTEANYRIFLVTDFGMVTIFYFEDTNKIKCKSKKFLDKIKLDAIIGKML
jgi:hypothetical protein